MKHFNNLLEAANYHRQCYACKSDRMNSSLVMEMSALPDRHSNGCVYKWNLSENVDSDTDDWVMVDACNNQIYQYQQSRRYSDDFIFTIGTESYVDVVKRRGFGNSKPNGEGLLYEGIHIDCGRCHQFGYTIQVVLDLSKSRVADINLNSEFYCYVDGGGVSHQIRNVYVTDKTEYSYSVDPTPENDASRKTITIPLIPLDLKSPTQTVERIRKLSTFS